MAFWLEFWDGSGWQTVATQSYVNNVNVSISGDVSGSGSLNNAIATTLASTIGRTANQIFNFSGSNTTFNYDLTIPNSTNQTIKLRLNRANTGNGAGYEFQFFAPTSGVDTFTFGYNSGEQFGSIYSMANNARVVNYQYALNIADNGSYLPYNGGYGYLSSSGSVGTASGQNPYSINCANRVKASEFNAVSSIKTKNIEAYGEAIEQDALDVFKKIKFFKYKYKDTIKNGNGDNFGVIAENLRDVLPDYVSEDMDYVPNLLMDCEVCIISENAYRLKFDKKLEKIEGDSLKIIYEDGIIHVKIFGQGDNFLDVESEKKIGEKCFAYGTYQQCPSVAKNKIFEIGMVVLNNLIKRIESLEKKND